MADKQVEEGSWGWRMASSVSLIEDHEPRINAIVAAMEAAAEMECVKLKVLLAECHAVLNEAGTNDASPTMREGLLNDVLEATQ